MRIVQIGEHCKFGHIKLIGTTSNGNSCAGCYFRSKYPDCEMYHDKLKVVCYYNNNPDIKSRIFIKL